MDDPKSSHSNVLLTDGDWYVRVIGLHPVSFEEGKRNLSV